MVINGRQAIVDDVSLQGPLLACRHVVQLYGRDSPLLAANVSDFLARGLEAGDRLLLIATPTNTAAICDALHERAIDPLLLARTEHFVMLDAAEMLGRFMNGGEPDGQLFRNTVGSTVANLRASSPSAEISAYGEMVGLLWSDGYYSAAIALEALWNELLSSTGSRLFCGYPIDIYGDRFHECDVEALLSTHTHYLPQRAHGLEAALHCAIRDRLGPSADACIVRMSADLKTTRGQRMRAESMVLWLRKNLRAGAGDIISRALELSGSPAIS